MKHFHTGRWDEAVPSLRQAVSATDNLEAHAALGISLMFQGSPLELGIGVQAVPASVEEAQRELAAAAECTWPEVGACMAWLRLLVEAEQSSSPPPADLQTLVSCASQSSWFTVRALACRALVFYDRRQEALALVADHSVSEQTTGMDLVMAEARLEAGQFHNQAWNDLLRPVTELCLPLPTVVAEAWRQLLNAEISLAQGVEPGAAMPVLRALVESITPLPAASITYAYQEQQRLAARACAAHIRLALAQEQVEQAAQWLEHPAITALPRWERAYLQGLAAWQRGARTEARGHLEESLAANPYQSRVRVELGVLLATDEPEAALAFLATLPEAPDAAACRAAIHTRMGHLAEARNTLAMLDRTDIYLPGRLVWPAAQAERQRRGWLLRAEVAEHYSDWQQAMVYLEQAQRISAQDVSLFRARRLWLRYQQAEQLSNTDCQEADRLLKQIDKELVAMAARPLTGEAMFYRSLVAAGRLPERAVKDWQALLRQRQWIERVPDVAGPRLLWIGDRLWQADLREDALRAYRRACELGATGAAHRLALALVQSQSVGTLDQAIALDPGDSLWPLLAALTALAATPPEASVASAQAELARCHHAQPALVDLVETICALLQNDPQAPTRLTQYLAQVPADTLPASVHAGFAAILPGQPAPAVLQSLMDASADQWTEICPVPPEALLHRAAAELIEQGQPEAALAMVRQAEQAGVTLPYEALATILAACAVRAGLQDQLEQADRYLQHARQLLAGSHKGGTNT
jgi:hypothetical protein